MSAAPRTTSRRSTHRSSFVAPSQRSAVVPDALSWRENVGREAPPKGPAAWSAASVTESGRTVVDAGPYGIIDLAPAEPWEEVPQLGVVWWDKRSFREEDDDLGTIQTSFVPASTVDHVSLAPRPAPPQQGGALASGAPVAASAGGPAPVGGAGFAASPAGAGGAPAQAGGAPSAASSVQPGGAPFGASPVPGTGASLAASPAPAAGAGFAASPVQAGGAPFAASPVQPGSAPFGASPVPGTGAPFAASPVPGTGAPFAASPVPATGAPFAASPVPATGAPSAASPVPATGAPFAASPVPPPAALSPASPVQAWGAGFAAQPVPAWGAGFAASPVPAGGAAFDASPVPATAAAFVASPTPPTAAPFVGAPVPAAAPTALTAPPSPIPAARPPAPVAPPDRTRHARRSRHVALVPKGRGGRMLRTEDGHPRRSRLRRRRARRRVAFGAAIVAVAFTVTLLIQTMLVTPFTVPSSSMENTLRPGDRIAVNRLAYASSTVQRGDVVVFRDPGGWKSSSDGASSAGDFLVKRVVGIPGDRVTCCSSDGRVSVNGRELTEAYAVAPAGEQAAGSMFDVTVPAGSLWVLGDNRALSHDSSRTQHLPTRGFVPIANVVGQAVATLWPLDHIAPISSGRETFTTVPDALCPI